MAPVFFFIPSEHMYHAYNAYFPGLLLFDVYISSSMHFATSVSQLHYLKVLSVGKVENLSKYYLKIKMLYNKCEK